MRLTADGIALTVVGPRLCVQQQRERASCFSRRSCAQICRTGKRQQRPPCLSCTKQALARSWRTRPQLDAPMDVSMSTTALPRGRARSLAAFSAALRRARVADPRALDLGVCCCDRSLVGRTALTQPTPKITRVIAPSCSFTHRTSVSLSPTTPFKTSKSAQQQRRGHHGRTRALLDLDAVARSGACVQPTVARNEPTAMDL